jgi:hypothetical protein
MYMTLKPEELLVLCDYFNSTAQVPPEVRVVANKIREVVYPRVVARAEKMASVAPGKVKRAYKKRVK